MHKVGETIWLNILEVYFSLFFMFIYLFLRGGKGKGRKKERERESEQEQERERERESQAGSTLNTEADVRLELTSLS